MRDLVSKKIDGVQYEFSQFGAKYSLKLLVRISKIVGKPLAMAIASAEGPGKLLDKTMNAGSLAMAVEALMERVDENEALELIESLTSKESCLCGGAKIDFNSHYEGKLPHMFKVLFAALEVQYGNFFDALNDLPVMSSQATKAPPVA